MRVSRACRALLLATALVPAYASAQIVKCRDAQGRLTYTAEKCPAGTTPEELPANLPRQLPDPDRPRSSPFVTETLPPMSAALRAQEATFRHCFVSNTRNPSRCVEYEALKRHCYDPRHWDEPQCLPLAEFFMLTDAESRVRHVAIRRERCKVLKPEQCTELYCGADRLADPEPSHLLDCARKRQLLVGRTWVQFDNEHDSTGLWHGRYACLKAYRLRAGAGQWVHARHFFAVKPVLVDGKASGRFVVPSKWVADRVFGSIADAAEETCEVYARRFEERARRPENRGAVLPPDPPVPAGAVLPSKAPGAAGRLPAPPETPEFRARVAEFEARFPACNGQRKPGCQDWDELQDHCRIRRHRHESDCQAMRLALPVASLRQLREISQISGEKCRRGDSGACRVHYCSIVNRHFTGEELLGQCSRVTGLPSSALWWQVGRQPGKEDVTSIFVCRRVFTVEGHIGQLWPNRGLVFVRSPAAAGAPTAPHRVTSLGRDFESRTFDSVDQAADAACRSENERLARLAASVPRVD